MIRYRGRRLASIDVEIAQTFKMFLERRYTPLTIDRSQRPTLGLNSPHEAEFVPV